mmetsp:Transcript_81755/g.176718  ORF Transcript_81755/g.176718 Transcript_81755/m.176718 type:complete len:220 (+) Transcript_81755:509-1168(+)
MLSATRCLNSANCEGLAFFSARRLAGSAPGGGAGIVMRWFSTSRSTVPRATVPPVSGVAPATVAACGSLFSRPSASSARSSSLACFPASLSSPVGTLKDASIAGRTVRCPIISAASDSTRHWACSAIATKCVQLSALSAPMSVSCAYSWSLSSPRRSARRSRSIQNFSAAITASFVGPPQGQMRERSSCVYRYFSHAWTTSAATSLRSSSKRTEAPGAV